MKEFFTKAKEWIYEYMVGILLFISALLLYLSKAGFFIQDVEHFLNKMGFAVLSSGVFAAVLKSLQFTGIFKNALEEIILGTDFIENRSEKNQHALWKTTSKAIYKKKFPELSNFIEERILTSYLPIKQDYYYRDYVATINITEINDNFDICYYQTTKFEVVLDENCNEAEVITRLVVNENEEEQGFENDWLFYKVNGVDYARDSNNNQNNEGETNYETFTNGNKVITKVKLVSKNGNKVFKLHRKVKRQYSLKDENYKLVRMSTFTKGVDVVISFPDNVGVSFFNIGNVHFFEPEHVDLKNRISRSHKNDVILPYQGFGMSFELKK